MKFHLATLANLGEIATLFHSCWHISYAELLSEEVRKAMNLEESKALWRPSLANPEDKETVIGISDSKIVSVFRIGRAKDDAGLGHLFSLYVDPIASGKGFGRKSLTEAIDRLSEQGFETITLWVFEANSIARNLYKGLGFEPTGETRVDERWQELEIKMLKRIIQ